MIGLRIYTGLEMLKIIAVAVIGIKKKPTTLPFYRDTVNFWYPGKKSSFQ